MKILLTLIVACAAMLPVKTNAQTTKTLPSGLYEIVPKSAIGFKHPQTGKMVYVEPKTAITLKMCSSLKKDYNVNDASPEIWVQLDSAGTVSLKKITTRLAGKEMAIVTDNRLLTTPKILTAITTGGFTISNQFNNTECDRLKAKLEEELAAIRTRTAATAGK